MLDRTPELVDRSCVRDEVVPSAFVAARPGPDVRGPPAPFVLTPYRHCELGCAACVSPRSGELHDRLAPEPFALPADLAPGCAVVLGTVADPYPPRERLARTTRALLESLARIDGLRLRVITRSDAILRDLDVLQEIAARGQVQVDIALTTLDRDLARRIEPRAAAPRQRLDTVSRLVAAGIAAGVHATPVLPGLTDAPRDLRALVCEAQAASARWFLASTLTLDPAVRGSFFTWLEGVRPELVTSYRRWYRGSRAVPSVSEPIERTVDFLRRQYGLRGAPPAPVPVPAGPRQLSLFDSILEPKRAGPPRAVRPARPALPPRHRAGHTGAA